LGFIYRNDILDAIDTIFNSDYKQNRQTKGKQTKGKDSTYQGYYKISPDTEPRDSFCFLYLSYYGLRKLSTDILNKNISNRDFKPCLKKMTEEGDLKEYEIIDSKRNIKPKLYSQTKKARMRYRLRVHQETIGQREKTYQLLLLYHAFRDAPVLPMNILEDDQQLQNFLTKEFSLHHSDFRIESVSHNRNLYRVTHMVREVPVPDIRYSRVDYLPDSGKEGKYQYRYRLPGISIREFLRGMHGGQALEHLPKSLSQSEVEEYFNLLEQQGLIKQVLVFRGETRYDVVDDDLRLFLKDCWVVHGIASIVMNDIWKLVRKPTEEERKWYEMLWGKHRAMIHLNRDYETRKIREKDQNKKGYRKITKEEQSRITDWGYIGIVEHFRNLKEKHSITIRNHQEVSHMLIKMVYPRFLHTLIEENLI
jgi:hypothetical protein